MSNKKVKTMLFIFLILFCIAAVNAESLDDTIDLESAKNVKIESGVDVAVIADGTDEVGNFSALNQTINGNSDSGQTKNIQLNMSYTYNESTDSEFKNGINITNNVVIDGQGHTIDGNYSARIFNITAGASLTLKNIKLINGNGTTYGGAIYNSGNLTLDNATFSNNKVYTNITNGYRYSYGGAIYSNGNLTVVNSVFTNNSAITNHTGNSYTNNDYAYGGAIYSNGTLTVTNSIFTNNSAITNHTNDTYYNYYDYAYGGAIYSNGTLTVTNSTFTNNSAIINYGSGYGGNGAYGGAIYSNGTLTVTNSTFTNNRASNREYDGDDDDSYGGAIYSSGNTTIADSKFISNAARMGGAIYHDDDENYEDFSDYGDINNRLTVINSTFSQNKAREGGGAIFATYVNATNSLFEDNFGGMGGGAVFAGFGLIDNCTFINNGAGNGVINITDIGELDDLGESDLFGMGGALYIMMGNISNSKFINNSALMAGAIFGGIVNITNSTFSNNDGGLYGGALLIGMANVTNSTFIDNSAKSGGAIYFGPLGLLLLGDLIGGEGEEEDIVFPSLTIIGSEFIGNDAKYGGAVYSTLFNTTIDDSKFSSNNATMGGAVYYGGLYDVLGFEFSFAMIEIELILQIIEQNPELMEYLMQEEPELILIFKVFEALDISFEEFFDQFMRIYIEMLIQMGEIDIGLENITEMLNNYSLSLKITNSTFEDNYGKTGDDIYTAYNTYVSGNNYTEGAYANIYADNTIINGNNVVSVLDNSTIYVYYDDQFNVNSTVFVDGASVNGYTVTITDGENNYTATYAGYGVYEVRENLTANFTEKVYTASIANATQAQYVVKNGTVSTQMVNVTVEVEFDEALAGENITGNITIKDANGTVVNVTGPVTVEINGKTYTVEVTEGKGRINFQDEFGPGDYTVNVQFPGQGKYAKANTTANLTIADDGVILIVHDLTKYYGNGSQFIIMLTDSRGNPIANQVVEVTINGVTYTRETDANGTIMMSINLAAGVYKAEVAYGDVVESATITILPTIVAEDLVKYYRNGSQYYATFYNLDGTPLANTNVTFNIHGVFYTRETDENGTAKLNINLNPGEYIITAINPVNNESKSNNITVLSTVVGEDVVKYYRNGTQYMAKFTDADGNALANTNVTFNIHGVFYTRETDENGIATLNINLNPGEYVITAYNPVSNESYSNKITVLSIVETKNIEMSSSARKPFVATILNEQGEPLANANVTFNINGVFYYKTTDANGQASLDINLIPGGYIITTYYNDYSVSNAVVIQ